MLYNLTHLVLVDIAMRMVNNLTHLVLVDIPLRMQNNLTQVVQHSQWNIYKDKMG
jgi:hypothetical protein